MSILFFLPSQMPIFFLFFFQNVFTIIFFLLENLASKYNIYVRGIYFSKFPCPLVFKIMSKMGHFYYIFKNNASKMGLFQRTNLFSSNMKGGISLFSISLSLTSSARDESCHVKFAGQNIYMRDLISTNQDLISNEINCCDHSVLPPPLIRGHFIFWLMGIILKF